MKKFISLFIIVTYLVCSIPITYAKDNSLTSNVVLETELVALKSGEYKHYNAESLSVGAYDVYIKSVAQDGISVSVGADRYLQLIKYETNEYKTYFGKLIVDENTENIRIENTGKGSFSYNGLILEKIDSEAEIKVSETSTYPNGEISVCGKVLNYAGLSGIMLKATVYENRIKKSEKFYDINNEFLKEFTADGDKMTFAVWDIVNNKAISEEKTVYIGEKTDVYVLKDAKDGGNGSKDLPFNTLDEAQKEVRKLNDNMKGDIVVHISGRFDLEEKLYFTEEDSATNGFKVVWDGGDSTVISGRRVLGEMKPQNGANYVKVKSEKIPRQLYINNNHAVRARSENIEILSLYNNENYTGTSHIYDGIVVSKDVFKNGVESFDGMQVVFVHLWNRVFLNVSDIRENEDGNYIIEFSQPEFDAFFTPKQIEEVFFSCHIENSPLFLDEPGEWCYNGKTKEVFYIPKRFESYYGNIAQVAETEGLIDINTASGETVKNITFCGIAFEYGGWNEPQDVGFAVLQAEERYMPKAQIDEFDYGKVHTDLIPAQVSVKNAENVIIKNSEFKHLASTAVAFCEKTKESAVIGCNFSDISAAAINVGDTDVKIDEQTENFTGKITVSDNYITKVGADFPSSPAISVYYANAITVSHNSIEYVPYSGISLGWGWGRNRENCRDIKILNNKLIGVMGVQNDGGHIYTLGAMPGTVISGNYMEKSGDTRGGIYIDNSTQYVLIENNVAEVVNTWLVTETAAMYNKKFNTARNNYSRVKYKISEPELNNYEEAKSMYVAENNERAQEIIGKAGIISK